MSKTDSAFTTRLGLELHKGMKQLCLCLAVAALLSQTAAAQSGIIATGATLQKLSGEFDFTEGPACDAKGNVFFTDQPNNRILKWSLDGKITTWKQPCGRANGLSFDRKGNLWACADEKNELWRISPKGKSVVILKGSEGKLFNGPNDLWLRPQGGLYFTDPFYKRPYWQRGPKEQPEAVYFLGADLKRATRVISDLKQPNGIIGTPDGKKLFVADIGAGKTYHYVIQEDGSLTGKTLFCELGSDGLTIDDAGNVYLTGKGSECLQLQGRENRANRRSRTLDRQRLFRRRLAQHPVHHRVQGPLLAADAGQRSRQPITPVSSPVPSLRTEPGSGSVLIRKTRSPVLC